MAKYFPPDQVTNALNVMAGESSCSSGAVGDKALICDAKREPAIAAACVRDNALYGASYGLMQIRWLPGRPPTPELKDPERNLFHASEMYKRQGWCPWSAAHKIGLATVCR